MRTSIAWLLPCLLLLASCRSLKPSQLLPIIKGDPAVVVKSLRMPKSEVWYSRFAHHTWLDVRLEGQADWMRLEIPTPSSGIRVSHIGAEKAFANKRWGRSIQVRTVVSGPEVAEVGEQLVARAQAMGDPSYRAWPGPNSNTFITDLVQSVDGMHVNMNSNAVGKDFGLNFGPSETGAGLEIDAYVFGLQVGLIEGVEVHFIGLTLGIGVQPIRLKLPFLPELGF
ncbi:MAG: DUF3750 domain-containing protein [Planctomycetota bacterium]|nr:DUF3750 domain-containing protein [Planctomycetota bacterium]